MSHDRGVVRRFVAAISLAMLGILLTAGLASAHEHRHVADEKYEMVVGFLTEPAVQNQVNGLDLRVAMHDEHAGEHEEGIPVEGLQNTLQAEVTFGGQTRPLEIEPAWNAPGQYRAYFIPTAPGAYTYHIWGTIEGNAIDETFTSGPETFSEVAAIDTLLFPSVSTSVEDAAAAAADAQDSADSAQTLAIIGLIVGAIGVLAGLVGVFMAMQARKGTGATAQAD